MRTETNGSPERSRFALAQPLALCLRAIRKQASIEEAVDFGPCLNTRRTVEMAKRSVPVFLRTYSEWACQDSNLNTNDFARLSG